MKLYCIKRVTANTGIVQRLTPSGDYVNYLSEQQLPFCRAFLLMNNKDIKTYRIAEYADRKDARRHLLMSIYCVNDEEAKEVFYKLVATLEPKRRELLTGDWKIITKTERK